MIARESATGTSGVRLLLVEDDEGDAFLVRELLIDSPTTIDVVWVRSLSEAQAALPDGFDCVLIDLGLPDAHGLDALRGILAYADDTAVLVLTGLDDEHRGNEAVAAGAQDYLLKGNVDASALMRSIRYAVERKRAEEQLRQLYASELQAAENARLERGLLPHPRIRDAAVQVTTRYRSGRGGLLGGDFFDVVETSDDRLHVLIGDVSGHGPDEAALGVSLRVAWRTLVLAGVPDEHLLTVLEDVLVAERRSDEIFATLCMVTVAASRDEADLLLAGHPAPLLLGPHSRQLSDEVINPAVGMVPGCAWALTKVALPPRWRLMLFTDGLIEGHIGEGGARLGIDGLLALLDDTPSAAPAGALADWLLVQAQSLHGEDLPDDVAIVVVEHEGELS